MPTSSSSSQTSSSGSRSPLNENERPLHSGSPQSSVSDDITGVINRRAERLHSLGIATPTTVMLGGRSSMQSPPPARPSTPISQEFEVSELFQGNPLRPYQSLPLSRGHLARRQTSPTQSARQPRRPPRPFLRISTQVDRIHRPRAFTPAFLPGASQPNELIQESNGEEIIIRQPRLPPVATPTVASLRAALTNNNSRFFNRLQSRKAELISTIQPHCPRISELCSALCSCRHALKPINRWIPGVRELDYIATGVLPVHVPSAEHAHTWVFSTDGVKLALDIMEDIMKAEMPVTVKDSVVEVEDILESVQKSLQEEISLWEQRTGNKGHSRWKVSWDRNEDERKRWVNGGYQDVLTKRESMQMGRRDSTATVALAHIPTVELDQTSQGNENAAPEQTSGRVRAAASVANAVGMMRRRLSAERRESTAPQATPPSAPAADPIAQQLGQQTEAQSRMRRAQTTLAQSRARHAREAASILRSPQSPTSQSRFDRLNAEYRQSTAGQSLQAGESLPRSVRGLTQPHFSRRNVISWPRERSITSASPISAPNQDAVNEQTYEAAHFAPLPLTDTVAEGEGGGEVSRADERSVFDANLDRALEHRGDILSHMRENSRRASDLTESSPLSNADLEAREPARREAEQWERAGYQSTPDSSAERRQARAQEIAEERLRLVRRRQARERARERERERQAMAGMAGMAMDSLPYWTFGEPSDSGHLRRSSRPDDSP